MKNVVKLTFWLVFFLFLFNIFVGSYYLFNVKKNIFKVISPLPNLITGSFNSKAQASDFWQPNLSTENQNKGLLLTSKAAISYDLTTDKLLYSENMGTPLPMASLTKIMTAVIVLENMDLSQKVKISKKAATVGEDSMGLSEGEIHAVDDLLYGLLLPSGNDAAIALAEGSPMGEKEFLYAMNKKAEEIGLSSTRFSNTSGLEGDGHQYTTVKDLLILIRYALRIPFFAKIVSTYQYDINASNDHKEYVLYNETNLLTTYPGVKGVKTGYTEEAGMCLASFLEHKNHKIIAILLNSQNRRFEMKELLDYSLRKLGETPPPHN